MVCILRIYRQEENRDVKHVPVRRTHANMWYGGHKEGESRVFDDRQKSEGKWYLVRLERWTKGDLGVFLNSRDTQNDTGLQTTYNDLESKDIEIPAACICCHNSKHVTSGGFYVLQFTFYGNVL